MRATSAAGVLATLKEVFEQRGTPRTLRSDNGGEFKALDLQIQRRQCGVEPLYTDPGSFWQNPFIESFHGKLRDELLNREVFCSVPEAQVCLESQRQVYNQDREHSSLGYRTPE